MSKKKYKISSLDEDKNGLVVTKEEKALLEFKMLVKHVSKPEHDDVYMHKWLKARLYDVDKAATMYIDSMQFMKKMGIDKILDYKPPKVLREYLTGGTVGFDKEGSPIRIELYGYLDMKGIMYSTRKIDLEKTKLQHQELVKKLWHEQSEKLGKRIDNSTVIFDLENVGSKSLWRPGLQMYLHLVKMLEDNYPEMMKRMFVINAPRIFPLLWKICRPLISEDMKNKIFVLGSDYKEVLLTHIDASQLPAFLGGEMRDDDGNPRCPSKICQGGEVPQNYYLSETLDTENMDSATIAKGDQLKLEFTVDKPGSILRYEYKTEDYDIGFGVYKKLENGKELEVLPSQRLNCHLIPEEGDLVCEDIGIYEVRFDNTFSWTRDKKLYYTIELFSTDRSNDDELAELADSHTCTRVAKDLQSTQL